MSKILQIIHPDGWKFIAIFACISLVFSMLSVHLGWIGLILTIWCAYFFRNPVRVVPQRDGLIVSPADGVICQISNVTPDEDLELGSEVRTRVSIFLNVFDVHVNRVPVSGRIIKTIYHEGQFINASFDKASEKNERNTVVLEMANNTKIAFVQIAGLIARRIVCNVTKDEDVVTGQIFGLIRFGSRMDVFLPPNIEPNVLLGQKVIAGETIIADINHPEPIRVGNKI